MKHHLMRATSVLLLTAVQNEMWQDSITVVVPEKLLFFSHKKLWKSAGFWKDFLAVKSACMLSKSLRYQVKWFGGNYYVKENRIAVNHLSTGRSLPSESGMLKGRIKRHIEIQYFRTVDNINSGLYSGKCRKNCESSNRLLTSANLLLIWGSL